MHGKQKIIGGKWVCKAFSGPNAAFFYHYKWANTNMFSLFVQMDKC